MPQETAKLEPAQQRVAQCVVGHTRTDVIAQIVHDLQDTMHETPPGPRYPLGSCADEKRGQLHMRETGRHTRVRARLERKNGPFKTESDDLLPMRSVPYGAAFRAISERLLQPRERGGSNAPSCNDATANV